MRMYDYTKQFLELGELVESGAVDPEVIQDTLEAIEGEATEKASNVARMIDNLEAQAALFKEEAKKLDEKAKTLTKNAEYLMNQLEMFLKATGKEAMQVGVHKLGYRKLPDAVQIVDENKIPEAYWKIKVDYNKTAIKKAIQDGVEVPGAVIETDRRKFVVKK